MRYCTLLLTTLLLAAPLFAQDIQPTTQPTTLPSARKIRPYTTPAPVTYQQALQALDVPQEKKAAATTLFETRDRAIQEWYDKNKAELAQLQEQIKNARQANDTPTQTKAQTRLNEIDKEQEAIRTRHRAALNKLFNPNEIKGIDSPMRTSPPPLDGSKRRWIIHHFETPQFTPEITASAQALLSELATKTADPNTPLIDRQNAIEVYLCKILVLFPDGQQFHLVGEIHGETHGSGRSTSPFILAFTADQTLAIAKILAESKALQSSATPTDVEKSLRQIFATFTPQQQNDILWAKLTLKGVPYTDQDFLPLTPPMALDALSLAPEQKAQALKIIQDFFTRNQPTFDEINKAVLFNFDLQIRAREREDKAALDTIAARISQLTQDYQKRYAGLAEELSGLLTPSDFHRYIILTTTSPTSDSVPIKKTSPKPTMTQALDIMNIPEEKKAVALKAASLRNEKMHAWFKTHGEEFKATGAALQTAFDQKDIHAIRENTVRYSEMQNDAIAIDNEYTAAILKVLTPEEFQKLTDLTTHRDTLTSNYVPKFQTQPEKPEFTPERVRAIYAALSEMIVDPPPGRYFTFDQDTAIQAGLVKAFKLFPGAQQLDLFKPSSLWTTKRLLDLKPDQVARIKQIVADMKNQPEGVSAAASASQALHAILDLLSESQKQFLFGESFNRDISKPRPSTQPSIK